MLLLAQDPSPADLDEEKRPNPRPYVIDRLQFKRDYVGYLDRQRTHVYVIDIEERTIRQLTDGDFDDSQPTWSPDGSHIVFVSNRTEFPDRNRNTDLWRIDASEGLSQPEQLTSAAQGYVVIMPNFRGSWGYGQAFTHALIGKWGDIDFHDSMAAMDVAIDKGWVDEGRMATFGWSWGGYLTNHIITKTDRFKAAISGAGETLVAANYGHDEWQRLWEEELGFPWLEENRQAWERASPFYSLDKVTTPTLIVCGEDDWNMPVINSEQLYIGLKRRGIPTQLVVYPGQHHSLAAPSYEHDLYERYIAWLKRYLVR